ncbi:hypothetical protein HELRODRAFT_161886 [Helobdella robusta]|uniref:Uncharacterized protein n=1 Tax=Helobdella robusta TaxID=6412 RepID=T1ES01_HELRO|nr:hypothetical protein HELRODRAFT_161886 [Helobdella robusta]ESO02596.1 hypothetical protein HELRODRAFT_161886 [Helobdella robusta]
MVVLKMANMAEDSRAPLFSSPRSKSTKVPVGTPSSSTFTNPPRLSNVPEYGHSTDTLNNENCCGCSRWSCSMKKNNANMRAFNRPLLQKIVKKDLFTTDPTLVINENATTPTLAGQIQSKPNNDGEASSLSSYSTVTDSDPAADNIDYIKYYFENQKSQGLGTVQFNNNNNNTKNHMTSSPENRFLLINQNIPNYKSRAPANSPSTSYGGPQSDDSPKTISENDDGSEIISSHNAIDNRFVNLYKNLINDDNGNTMIKNSVANNEIKASKRKTSFSRNYIKRPKNYSTPKYSETKILGSKINEAPRRDKNLVNRITHSQSVSSTEGAINPPIPVIEKSSEKVSLWLQHMNRQRVLPQICERRQSQQQQHQQQHFGHIPEQQNDIEKRNLHKQRQLNQHRLYKKKHSPRTNNKRPLSNQFPNHKNSLFKKTVQTPGLQERLQQQHKEQQHVVNTTQQCPGLHRRHPHHHPNHLYHNYLNHPHHQFGVGGYDYLDHRRQHHLSHNFGIVPCNESAPIFSYSNVITDNDNNLCIINNNYFYANNKYYNIKYDDDGSNDRTRVNVDEFDETSSYGCSDGKMHFNSLDNDSDVDSGKKNNKDYDDNDDGNDDGNDDDDDGNLITADAFNGDGNLKNDNKSRCNNNDDDNFESNVLDISVIQHDPVSNYLSNCLSNNNNTTIIPTTTATNDDGSNDNNNCSTPKNKDTNQKCSHLNHEKPPPKSSNKEAGKHVNINDLLVNDHNTNVNVISSRNNINNSRRNINNCDKATTKMATSTNKRRVSKRLVQVSRYLKRKSRMNQRDKLSSSLTSVSKDVKTLAVI